VLIVGTNPGHNGAVAVVRDRELLFCLESEKDSFLRHQVLTPMTMLDGLELAGEIPDVIALGGQEKEGWFTGAKRGLAAGYLGTQAIQQRQAIISDKPVTFFSSSHVRSHIMMAAGMAPPDDEELRAVLVWEGNDGSFYLLDNQWDVIREIPVLRFPGTRYKLLYAIADPRYEDWVNDTRGDEAGKIMALAGYGDSAAADADLKKAVERILEPNSWGPTKGDYRDCPFYNKGVEAPETKVAASLLQDRLFEIFARAALKHIPAGIPLYISGGCGLNCDWNTMWRELGHFSSVFVPPCADDSGSALGTVLDALYALTGDPRIEWDVYCGLEFEWDSEPDSSRWARRPMRQAEVADALAGGRVAAWVQGRWEMGPRALGNRSLLAEPFDRDTLERLNHVKKREGYRPIAPCCRIEDAGKVFDADFHDPYMLYFRRVRDSRLGAVTHVDGSARAQTVTKESNAPLHGLLSAFAELHGVGVLCNTSLNYKGLGFINNMSDLVHYCEEQGVPDMVVGDTWFQRVEDPIALMTSDDPKRTRLVRALISENIPEGATVLVISQGKDEMLDLNGRHAWHFPQNEDGSFHGHHPADSGEAIAWVEKLKDKGASYFVIPAPDFWWLEFYSEFAQHLMSNYRVVARDEALAAVFALQE
jgi:hydroxymethyl cephem carbamoyltransferase